MVLWGFLVTSAVEFIKNERFCVTRAVVLGDGVELVGVKALGEVEVLVCEA